MHPLMNIAIKAARSASKTILRATDRLDTIKITEKNHNDFVTDIDQQAEQEIINTIHNAYPDHAIFGEESGKSGESEYTWIIDPIDGTTNFLHGHPHFCISIGVQFKNIIEHGLIYDPLRQELFTATRGTGAFLNDRRMRVAQRKQFAGSVIASGFGNKTIKNIDIYLKILAAILPQAAGTRRSGSAALDFAYVACGRIDGFWEMNLAPWDMAAGSLIVKEAGGIVDEFSGNGNFMETGNVIAGNQHIFNLISQIVKAKKS
ncbi:MAG: myo-inositol-1(or 4)-monophosphatase [uncultured bacterium]|nr:MAG: myo-inositol-1(or 4)-monophosphatase [uncultured bacterium]